MSQSAENQSAIIENENNFNIAVESQAVEAESSQENVNPEEDCGGADGDLGPGTPTQDEAEERMDTNEGQQEDGAVSAGSGLAEDMADTHHSQLTQEDPETESSAAVTAESQADNGAAEFPGAVDAKSPLYSAERQEQEGASGTMDVDEPEGQMEGFENTQNEGDFADDVQEDNGDQQMAGESAEVEQLDAKPVDITTEADTEAADSPGHSQEAEDQDTVEDEGGTQQTAEVGKDLFLEDEESERDEGGTGRDPDLSEETAEEKYSKTDVAPAADDDSQLISEEVEQPHDSDRPEVDENPQLCDDDQDAQGEQVDADQQMSLDEGEQERQAQERIDEDKLLAMSEGEQNEQSQSGSNHETESQLLAGDEGEPGAEPGEGEQAEDEQLLATNDENDRELLESEQTESGVPQAMEESEGDQQASNSQHFQGEKSQDQKEESEEAFEPTDDHLEQTDEQLEQIDEQLEQTDEQLEQTDEQLEQTDEQLKESEHMEAESCSDTQQAAADLADQGKDNSEANEPINKDSSAVSADDEVGETIEGAAESNPENAETNQDDAETKQEDSETNHDMDAEMDQESSETLMPATETTEPKASACTENEKSESDDVTMDPEADRASDVTIEEGRDIDDEASVQGTDAKTAADTAEQRRSDSAENVEPDDSGMDDSLKTEGAGTFDSDIIAAGDSEQSKTQTGGDSVADKAEEGEGEKKVPPDDDDDDDDVVLLDDDDSASQNKKENGEEFLNSNNDMGIQIESVSGGANEVHGSIEATAIKQEGADQKPTLSGAPPQNEAKSSVPPAKKSRTQTCLVCKKVGKCKYNIVRNGDIKHLCDDTCFKRFRANPTQFLKGSPSANNAPAAADKKSPGVKPAAGGAPAAQGTGKASVPSYKTCTVCLLMNINAQGQFCIWKGLDFCGEGCLGKFQSGIRSECALCSSFIPLASRSNHCMRLGNQMKPFCSGKCFADYKLRMRLCAMCQKDAGSVPEEEFFSAPVGSDSTFKDFCSQTCMKKFEELLITDVEVIKADPSKPRAVGTCSICQKKEMIQHSIKHKGTIHSLCSDPACLSALQLANKIELKTCDFCTDLCTSRDASLHEMQHDGQDRHFCSDSCLSKFRLNNRKVAPCSWCGAQRDSFDMIERQDSSTKYQLFCSLNCLSLYRVNLQAKSNQPVACDQCSKRAPAQYHLTMSDASVRNFCTYNCVMTFQAQFSKRPPGPPAASPPAPPPPPQPSTPKHRHNTRGKAGRGRQQQTASQSFPIISNVISLASQGQPQVNIKNSTGMQVTGAGLQAAIQQQVIVQPPPPKPVKNKSILCKPMVQTKATSCRPHTQSKECQTDDVKEKPIVVPVPVPIHLPAPMAMYTAPAPTPIFIPIPIPVPIFIPTTRKSANGILKQIKEIREKTPSDPLEAELLMMAAAVSADGKNSSDSESDDDMLPEINRSRKRCLAGDDDDDNDVMPLTSSKEEVGGEEDMISMALRMAEEMSGPITDLESAVEAVPVNTEPPPQPPRPITPDTMVQDEEMIRNRRGGGATKRGGVARSRGGGGGAGGGGGGGSGRPAKRPRIQVPQPEPIHVRQEPPPPPPPPADANYHLKFTYGVNAWRHWVLFKNNQIERTVKPSCGRVKLFKTDIMQCTADELNFSLCLFIKEVRKPNGEEYSPDSIYYLCLGIQQYLYENGRIDNIFTDFYYDRFTEGLTQILSKCQPKFNASGQMVCRIEEEHLWECKQLGAHSPYVLLNTLIYFHTKYFMLKTPEDHMKLSFAHILKYWKKGQPGKGGQPARSVSLRYYSVSTAKKDGSAPTSATKKGSKDGIPVYEVTENSDNPLRCPVKLYEFYLSKCPESIKNRSDIFYPVPERSCVPDSPVWYSTMPLSLEAMTKMLTRILLVREIQEAHLHASPIYV